MLIRKPQVISRGGGVRTPCTLPLDPPLVFVYVSVCGILFVLKPFRDYSLCSVCILPQSAFYSQSVVCILHSVCILPLVRSLQSAVRSLRFTLTVEWICKSYKNLDQYYNHDCFLLPLKTLGCCRMYQVYKKLLMCVKARGFKLHVTCLDLLKSK